MDSSGDITLLLAQLKNRDPQVAARLMDFVYAELRRMARACMRQERSDHTLQPTALVHEVFIRLIGEQQVDWRGRAHFLGLAAHVMRRVLVEYARRRNTAKRGGLQPVIELHGDIAGPLQAEVIQLIDLEAALDGLAQMDARLGRVVELRYFGGLSMEEVAEVLSISTKTVKRDWTIAKAWLRGEMGARGA